MLIKEKYNIFNKNSENRSVLRCAFLSDELLINWDVACAVIYKSIITVASHL